MKVLPCGDRGLLVEPGELDDVLRLYGALADDPPDGVLDLVPAARTVLVRAAPGTDLERLAREVTRERPDPGTRPSAGSLEIPVRYDGADLAEVARRTGLREREVVEAHTSQQWTVAFCGFAPGFGYLVGSDDRLRVPRRDNPRTRVPAGAVGLAGEFTGVYPRPSPGGWQLIGHTTRTLWDLEADPPALLQPGVRVRFVET